MKTTYECRNICCCSVIQCIIHVDHAVVDDPPTCCPFGGGEICNWVNINKGDKDEN